MMDGRSTGPDKTMYRKGLSGQTSQLELPLRRMLDVVTISFDYFQVLFEVNSSVKLMGCL